LHASASLAATPSGADLYFNHCAACHGPGGEGPGPLAATMRVTVPNLRSLAQRSRGTFPAAAVAAYIDGRHTQAGHGDRPMPVGHLRSVAQRRGGTLPADAVAAYIAGRDTKAARGDRQMPVWGEVFRGPEQGTARRTVRRRIAALVDYIRTLQYR